MAVAWRDHRARPAVGLAANSRTDRHTILDNSCSVHPKQDSSKAGCASFSFTCMGVSAELSQFTSNHLSSRPHAYALHTLLSLLFSCFGGVPSTLFCSVLFCGGADCPLRPVMLSSLLLVASRLRAAASGAAAEPQRPRRADERDGGGSHWDGSTTERGAESSTAASKGRAGLGDEDDRR